MNGYSASYQTNDFGHQTYYRFQEDKDALEIIERPGSRALPKYFKGRSKRILNATEQ